MPRHVGSREQIAREGAGLLQPDDPGRGSTHGIQGLALDEAAMLEATSLAVQPDLRAQLTTRTFPFYYLCGERDDKFRALAAEISVPSHVIRNAGHNAHRDNPAGVVDCLAQILHR